MPRLTGSQMKYLHVIYMAQQDAHGIRAVDVARKLGVSKPSVTRMTKLFLETGLIRVGKGGAITLMPAGESEGSLIHEKMTRVYPFFAEYLELPQSEALDSAYSFLGGLSDCCIERLLEKGWALDLHPV